MIGVSLYHYMLALVVDFNTEFTHLSNSGCPFLRELKLSLRQLKQYILNYEICM